MELVSPPKQRLIILTDWFAPGYKAGGPIRSCVNVARLLKDEFELFVITTNMDHGESQPYAHIPSNTWITAEAGIKVWYFSKDQLRYHRLKTLLHDLMPASLYMNSMFSLPFTIWPLLMPGIRKKADKIVLAPRGMLKSSALQYKALKKTVFLRLVRNLGLAKNIEFHATNEEEGRDVQSRIGAKVNVTTLANVPNIIQPAWKSIPKQKGMLQLVYISRIAPVKNLLGMLQLLHLLPKGSQVHYTIGGPIENMHYWNRCLEVINKLPSHITANYIGEIDHSNVHKHLLDHHALALLTEGENFGHVIFENFQAGRLAFISDQTPWRNLEEKCIGWDIAHDNTEKLLQAIQKLAFMDQDTYHHWSQQAWTYAKEYVNEAGFVENYKMLFEPQPLTMIV